ncbi:unnamed protein product [Rangifer tarandus platyrhynchus]|uniref:Uncharacterized protein n=1 Tax=Rangifer tarandus platyrhynchus TaxID=3082113 RepID=A0ABN8YHZ2_RANTA|nr:unnamed protein product [Rangifer tarandus platyrhynchus]
MEAANSPCSSKKLGPGRRRGWLPQRLSSENEPQERALPGDQRGLDGREQPRSAEDALERVSDLPNDQEQGALCTSPRRYCLSELGSLAPRRKGEQPVAQTWDTWKVLCEWELEASGKNTEPQAQHPKRQQPADARPSGRVRHRAPAPSRPRHVTRHAPAARGLHQNKNREGRPAGLAAGSARGRRARPRCRCPAPRPRLRYPERRQGRAPRPAGGGRAEGTTLFTALAPGRGPRPETVSWERALECAPTRGPDVGVAWEVRAAARNKAASPRSWGPGPARVSAPPRRAAHGCFVSAPVTTLLRTSPPSSRLRRFRRPSSRGRLLPAPYTPRRPGCRPSCTSGPRAVPTPGRGYIARLGPPPHLPPREGG